MPDFIPTTLIATILAVIVAVGCECCGGATGTYTPDDNGGGVPEAIDGDAVMDVWVPDCNIPPIPDSAPWNSPPPSRCW